MHADFCSLEAELSPTLTDLNARETQATPLNHPEKWSIQQIVEHLLLTYRASDQIIQTRLDKQRPTRATPTLLQRIGQFSVLTLGRFPRGRRAPEAVSPSLPATLRSGGDLMQRLLTELNQLDALITKAELLFGSRPAVSHMILGPMSMDQWRRFHLVHGRHHAEQITSIRRDQSL